MSVFTLGKVQLGYVRQLAGWRVVSAGLGGFVALSVLPPALAPRYGGRIAPSFGVFLSVGAAKHQM